MKIGAHPQTLLVACVVVAACTPATDAPMEPQVDPPLFDISTDDMCPDEVDPEDCKPLEAGMRQALKAHVTNHIDTGGPDCEDMYNQIIASVDAGKWDYYPDFGQSVGGSYSPDTGRYSLNGDYFEKLGGNWYVTMPSWSYRTVGQKAVHEVAHGPPWGLQETAARSMETQCWNW